VTLLELYTGSRLVYSHMSSAANVARDLQPEGWCARFVVGQPKYLAARLSITHDARDEWSRTRIHQTYGTWWAAFRETQDRLHKGVVVKYESLWLRDDKSQKEEPMPVPYMTVLQLIETGLVQRCKCGCGHFENVGDPEKLKAFIKGFGLDEEVE